MYELAIPSWGQLIPLQMLRSVLFLGICYPVIRGWKGSPLKLWVSLSVTFFFLTAFMAVITAYWFPWRLRFFHGLELLADAAVYIGILIYLFTPDRSRLVKPSPNSQYAVRSAVITILVFSVFNLGCSAESAPEDQVFIPPVFSMLLGSGSDQKIQGELMITNTGDSQFPADSAFEGQMILWDENGDARSRVDAPDIPAIQPGDSLYLAKIHWGLDPGIYFGVWGSPKYGGVISGYFVNEESGQIRIGRSFHFRTKPIEYKHNAANTGQVKSFTAKPDGSLFITGETPLPDQSCIYAVFYNQEGLLDWYPPSQCVQIADGQWHINIRADAEQGGIHIQPDTSSRIILFSNDLAVPPSEPFEILISPPVQN